MGYCNAGPLPRTIGKPECISRVTAPRDRPLGRQRLCAHAAVDCDTAVCIRPRQRSGRCVLKHIFQHLRRPHIIRIVNSLINIMPDGKIESMYFLDFVKDKTKKVSYAASFGSEKKIKTELADITNYLKDFDKITVRENDGLRILRENGVLGEQVLDPTLLLNINDWNLVMENINLPNEYILLYQVNHNKDLCKKAAAFAKRKGMKLIRVTNDMSEIFWGEGFTYLPTPAQFLYIIKNAKYVITDSFHGTCFCINFNKNFIDVLPENHSQRNRSVLDFFDLTDRIISDDKFDFVEQSIDWSKVNNILMEQRKISMIELKSLCEI